ncbi:MAG: DUF2334 domain-containing protein [Pseudomonadota bacterium]
MISSRAKNTLAKLPVRYFVRDDDIGELTPALRTFMQAFAARRIPVSYQIIPDRLTDECAVYLLQMESAHPDLIEFGQHGLHHRMELRGKMLKREFGPERTYEEQAGDIAEGMRLLRRRLGEDRRIVIFTPPQHKFDRQTLKAAAEAGHLVFSAASYPSLRHRIAYAAGRTLGVSSIQHHGISYHGLARPEAKLREVSIAIAVDNGRRITTPATDLDAALERARAHTDIVGLMFHHQVYADTPGELEAIVERLARYPTTSFHRLESLAAS